MPPAIMPTDFTVLTTGLDFLSGRMANLPAGWAGREAWHSHWAMGGAPGLEIRPPGEGLRCGSYPATLVSQDSMAHGNQGVPQKVSQMQTARRWGPEGGKGGRGQMRVCGGQEGVVRGAGTPTSTLSSSCQSARVVVPWAPLDMRCPKRRRVIRAHSGCHPVSPLPWYTSSPLGPRNSMVSPIFMFSRYWDIFPPAGNLGCVSLK